MSTSASDHLHDREKLADLIADVYKMQPLSMLNPAVPLLMADAILAAGFTRAADWYSGETVRALRDGLRELVAPISTNQVPDPLDTLDALCDAVAVASRSLEPSDAAAGMTQQEWDDITPEHRNVIRERFVVAARAAEEGK